MTTGRAVVRQIDHIPYVVGDPTSLSQVLTEQLALPVPHWPGLPEPSESESSWITLGTIDLFFFQAQGRVPSGVQPPVIGIGFEPEPVTQSVAEMDRRGIVHDYRSEDFGGVKEVWCVLSGFFESRQGYVFISEFEYEDGRTHAEVRAQRKSIFDAAGGGSLALESVAELVVGAEFLSEAVARWQVLLDPLTPAARGLWHVGNGPALRVVEHERDEVVCLKLRTRDLNRAREVLRSLELLAGSSPEEIELNPEKLSGIALRLVPV